MIKRTFIPNWYIDKKDIIRNKKIKVCIIITLITNIFLLLFILNISNKIKVIEQEQVKEKKNSISVVETADPDIITREKYKELSDFFEENKFSYKNIIITKAGLEIDIEVKSYEEYVNVIRYIENKYSIKNLTPNNKDEGNFNFKVILEV